MLVILVAAAVVALDQVVKALSVSLLTALPAYTYPLWPGVFHLTYTENRGAAFGMLQNGRWLFIAATVVACGAIVWFLWKERRRMHPLLKVALALILGGALGNLIDRVFLGYVRDMFYAVVINFAIFNVADSAVCVGCGLLFIDLLFLKGKRYFDPPQKDGEGPAGGGAPGAEAPGAEAPEGRAQE